MNCLTICQPWAWAILHAGKPIENRSWALPEGPLLIHAGKSKSYWSRDLEEWWAERHAAGEISVPLPLPNAVPYGAIVGRCVVVLSTRKYGDAVRAARFENPSVRDPRIWMDENACYSVLSRVEVFDRPVPWVGRQGIFRVDDAELERSRKFPILRAGLNS